MLCWMSLFVISGVSGLCCGFNPIFVMANPASNQCRSRSGAHFGVSSGSALFDYDTFTGFPVRMGQSSDSLYRF